MPVVLDNNAVMLEGIQSNMGPMVSIILPTFNRPLYLAQAIASAVRQRYGNLEIIVVNDGGMRRKQRCKII